MGRKLHAVAISVLLLTLLTLASCNGMTVTPSTIREGILPPVSTELSLACDDCAQATLDSANATLNAVLTQEQNNVNINAAQIAATAEIVRADAQATLNSAGVTQNAVLAQAQYDLQVTAAAGTQNAEAVIVQQNKNDLAANTQTAVANNIATQTRAAIATSEWYADQSRQREEQRQQGPIAFLWMWCLPIFFVLLAVFALWGFWHWQKIQQSDRLMLETPVGGLQASETGDRHRRHDDPLPALESDAVDGSYQHTKPDDQIDDWLDEVKSKLLSSDEEEDDSAVN